MTNLRLEGHLQAVRIDRGTVWGNCYRIGVHGNRTEVLRRHELWLRREYELVSEMWRLRGLSLACWCDPLPCHGWLLFYLANCTEDQLIDWQLGRRYWNDRRIRLRSVPGAPACHDGLFWPLQPG